MILPASEWGEIEAGVVQRATLLNRILIDIYGEQQLLADGQLPVFHLEDTDAIANFVATWIGKRS